MVAEDFNEDGAGGWVEATARRDFVGIIRKQTTRRGLGSEARGGETTGRIMFFIKGYTYRETLLTEIDAGV